MADSFNDKPAEGDGFTYEHWDEREDLWLDFMADTGKSQTMNRASCVRWR